MPITTIDPNTALIVVDLQAAARHMSTVHPFDGVLANAARLADAFRAKKLPVVLVNVAGGAPGRTERGFGASALPADWTELLPELKQQPGDKTVTKYTWGAFHNTDLAGHLDGLGVTQVVVCGLSTAIGVESTARQAHEHGFHVALPVDAMTELDAAAHENSVEHIFPRLGETGTTAEVLAHLGS
ncbi:isochorismatase family protein [Streptomyces sp. NPDC020917]|uniref:isochorismatase family protein n=1 Tax=Streptomyces sp. NPDC020917 TaxID=3365102 RepID=UPI00379F8073